MIQALKNRKRVNNNNKKTNGRKDEEEWNQVNTKNRLPYWICIVIEEPSEDLQSGSLKFYLSLNECLLVCAFYACFLAWVIFVCLFMYLHWFSSYVDDYHENPSLDMNTNQRKFSTKTWPPPSSIPIFIENPPWTIRNRQENCYYTKILLKNHNP